METNQCPSCQWQRPAQSGELGKPAWAVAVEAKLPSKDSYIAAKGNLIFISTDNGQVIALDTLASNPDNKILWRHQIDSRYRCHNVALWKENVLLGNEFSGGFPTPPGELILLSIETGEEVWRHAVEGASLSVPVVQENIAYFTVNTGWVYAIDLEAHQELWRQKIHTKWSWSPLAPLYIDTDLLILTARNDYLVAFDINKRDVVWSFHGGGWFPYTSSYIDNTVYARCWDGAVYAIDSTTGQEKWHYKPAREFSSDLSINDRYVYVGAKDYEAGADQGAPTYALYTLDRLTGETVGRHQASGRILSRPIATEEAVFFTSDDRSRVIESQGTFYALDIQGNKALWEPYVVEQRFQTDLLVVGKWIIAGTRQGAIYAMPWLTEEAITESPQSYEAREEWDKVAKAYMLQGQYTQAAEVYTDRLDEPFKAGQLYLHVGQYHDVIRVVGQSEHEAEQELGFKAAQAMPNVDEQAKALGDMGEYLQAATIYSEAGKFEKSGDCYLEAQAFEEAQAAYAKGNAWDKWEKVAREQELWHDLVDRYVSEGEYAQAAEIQLGRGHFLDAANYYDQADMAEAALDAYSKVTPEDITEAAQQRMLALAQEVGKVDIALDILQATDQLDTAAELAESSGLYKQAADLYQTIGNHLKAAEVLEKLNHYTDAADMFEQARRWGQAAKNLERQVDQEIERAGGIRYVTDTEQLENWLNKAIELYDEEADYAEEDGREQLYKDADRCRVSLMRIRREPLLQMNLQADRLVFNQSNAIYYRVENMGWGAARNLTLTISGVNLLDDERYDLGTLGRRQKAEGTATVVPTLVGEIMLQVELLGQSKGGELRETLTHTIQVAERPAEGGPGVSLNTRIGHGAQDLRNTEAPIASRDSLWSEGSISPIAGQAETPVSSEQLTTQSRLKTKHGTQPIAIGATVISSVVISFELEQDDQEFVNGEMKWLFSAIDHFLNIRSGKVDRNKPVSVGIPSEAVQTETANNQVLSTIDDFDMLTLEGHIQTMLGDINTHLGNLRILRSQEARKGAAGKGDVALQNDINMERTEIVAVVQQLAQLMNQTYGIFVTSPDELAGLLQ